jgi:beta-mannosidase
VLSDAMQANYPVTAGLLPWVLKRPWPVAGIMMLDGFGQPAATYYFLKRTYEPVHAAFALPHLLWACGEPLPVIVQVMNAEPRAIHLVASAEIFDPQMKSRYRRTRELVVRTGPSVSALDLDAFTIPADFEEKFFFAVVELKDAAGKLVSRSVYWPRCLRRMSEAAFRDKYRSTPRPTPILEKGPWLKPQVRELHTRITARIVSNDRGMNGRDRVRLRVRNSGAIPAFMTRVDVEGRKRVFRATDNYFWLASGEERDLELEISWREPALKNAVCSVRAWNAATQRLRLTY